MPQDELAAAAAEVGGEDAEVVVERFHRVAARKRATMAAMCDEAEPSQSGGTAPRLAFPESAFFTSRRRSSVSRPMRWFVPWVTVMGRSVFSCRVKQGTPR